MQRIGFSISTTPFLKTGDKITMIVLKEAFWKKLVIGKYKTL